MKRTPLKRKTPLKSTCGFKKAAVIKTAKTSTQLVAFKKGKASSLVGKGKSNAQVEFHSIVVELGCFACNKLGLISKSRLVIHHPRGRNKGKVGDASEWFVICLCYEHHDPSTMCGADMTLPSVHCNKKLFVELVGTERWCVHETYRILDRRPPWIDLAQWNEYLALTKKEDQELYLVDFQNSYAGFHCIN